jgi:uncharacterized protein YggU (UPF0235/DUF167 family)
VGFPAVCCSFRDSVPRKIPAPASTSRVSARAVDGQATAAALAAVAAAFGVRRYAVTLVAGAASRTKIVDVAGADPAVLERLLAL